MNLYERIQKIADDKNVSISKIESEVGLSNGSISKWKKSTPNSDSLFKVANYLELSMEDLLSLQPD